MSKANARMITKNVSLSRKLPELSPDALNLFFLLIPHYDSHGKMNGDPFFIKGEVCRRFKRFTTQKIEKCLSEISEKTNVKWFEVDGLFYIHSLNFNEHQPGLRADRRGEDKQPGYHIEKKRETPQIPENSGSNPGELPPEVEVEVEVEVEDIIGQSSSDEDSPPPSEEKPVIELILNDKSLHSIYQKQIDDWKELYPAVDVLQELRKMKAWSEVNRKKRKTKTGIGRFIVSWLNRAQDNPKGAVPEEKTKKVVRFCRGKFYEVAEGEEKYSPCPLRDRCGKYIENFKEEPPSDAFPISPNYSPDSGECGWFTEKETASV